MLVMVVEEAPCKRDLSSDIHYKMVVVVEPCRMDIVPISIIR